MTNRPRDFQRKRVYAAEGVCLSESMYDIHDLRVWVNQVTCSRVFRCLYPNYYFTGIEVKDGRGRRRACGSVFGYINMPRWSRNKFSVLHELAHVVTRYDVSCHGEEFCQNYLTLVKHILGEQMHHDLQLRMKIEGVRFKPARELPPIA